jgi:uncharacterized membrane protein
MIENKIIKRPYFIFIALCWGTYTLSIYSNYWSGSRAWLFLHNLKEPVIWIGLLSYTLALLSTAIWLFLREKSPLFFTLLNTSVVCALFSLTGYLILTVFNVGDALKPKGQQILLAGLSIGAYAGIAIIILWGIIVSFRKWMRR